MSLTHPPTAMFPNPTRSPPPDLPQGSSEDRKHPSGPSSSQPTALQRTSWTSWQRRPPHPTPQLHHQLQPPPPPLSPLPTHGLTSSQNSPSPRALPSSMPTLGQTGGQVTSQLRRPQPRGPNKSPSPLSAWPLPICKMNSRAGGLSDPDTLDI